jgi:Tfp pilus assembly protein PilN
MSATLAVRPQTLTTLPHVNLLPQEIQEESRFRNVRAGLGLAVLLVALIIGFLYWQARGDVDTAQTQLNQAQAQQVGLDAKITTYSNVPKVLAQVDLAKAQLVTAMGPEVRYSFLLNDITLTIPNNVWLTQLTVQQKLPTSIKAGATSGTATGAQWTPPGIGNVTFAGTAMTYNDVAAWLDSFAKSPNYSGVYLNTATTGLISKTSVVQFTSVANTTPHAYSNRYAKVGP